MNEKPPIELKTTDEKVYKELIKRETAVICGKNNNRTKAITQTKTKTTIFPRIVSNKAIIPFRLTDFGFQKIH